MATFICADDSRRQRDVLLRLLRDEGHKVIAVCDDGGEAVDLCETMKPDYVILDVSMRAMNGDIAAHKIHAASPRTRIVMVSSLVQGAVSRPLIDGGFGFVSKPYNNGGFLARLKAVIARFDAEEGANNGSLSRD